jgi:hypothetical protein
VFFVRSVLFSGIVLKDLVFPPASCHLPSSAAFHRWILLFASDLCASPDARPRLFHPVLIFLRSRSRGFGSRAKRQPVSLLARRSDFLAAALHELLLLSPVLCPGLRGLLRFVVFQFGCRWLGLSVQVQHLFSFVSQRVFRSLFPAGAGQECFQQRFFSSCCKCRRPL